MMKKKQQAKKVWRIFRFKERFELADDVRFCRSGPLIYIRDYVGSGQDDESINYKRQIAACKASQNRHKLLSVFGELREIAANHSRSYRGYLLDERFEPADIGKISVWVGLDIKETDKLIKELEQIGLIELVPLLKFDFSLNEQPKKRGKGQHRQRTKSRNILSGHGKTRARSSAHGKSRSSFEHKGQSGNGNGNKKRNKSGKPEPDKNPKTTKANPNPINPKESDGGVGNHKQRTRTDPPRQSIKQQYRQTELLGAVLQKLYDPQAEQFAQEVYDAIGTRYDKTSEEGHSELACWKSAWAKAQMAGIGPRYLAELWDKVIVEAMKLKLKRRRMKFRRSPEAVLRMLFNRMLSSIKHQADEAGGQAIKTIRSKCAMSSQ